MNRIPGSEINNIIIVSVRKVGMLIANTKAGGGEGTNGQVCKFAREPWEWVLC